MLALSLRDSSFFRRVFSVCWCALLLARNILSIPHGYPLPLGRYRRGVPHGDARVGAAFLGLCEGSIALASLLTCAAGTAAGVDDVSAVPPRVRRSTS